MIVDIGCGNPTFLKVFQKKVSCQTMGIDFSGKGWKNQDYNFKNVNLQIAEIKDLSSNLHLDVITMWHHYSYFKSSITFLKN